MSPDDFRRLVSAGLSNEQIALVMEMMDRDAKAHAEAEEQRKSKGRERVAKWREGRNVTVTQQNVTVPLTSDHVAPVEDKPKPIDTDSSKKNTTSADLSAFKSALASLDADQIGGLIKIRSAKKAPMTGYAASLFVKAAASCNLSVAQAADMCIERNWLTVKPEWMPSARGSPKPQNLKDALNFLSQAERANHDDSRSSESSLRLISGTAR